MLSGYKANCIGKWRLVGRHPSIHSSLLPSLKCRAGRFCSKVLVHDIENVGLIIVSMHSNFTSNGCSIPQELQTILQLVNLRDLLMRAELKTIGDKA